MNYRLFDMNMNDRDLLFFDTETTGFELDKELIEIGAVRAKAKTFEKLSEIDIKIRPQRLELADPEALRVVGFDEAEWRAEGVSLTQGIKEFLTLAENTMLVGHNLAFDWMHIQKAIEACGFEPTYFYKGLDIFSMAWLKFNGRPGLSRLSLEMANHFGIDITRHHRAIDDARATYEIFLGIINAK